jgi:ATP synthase protein I
MQHDDDSPGTAAPPPSLPPGKPAQQGMGMGMRMATDMVVSTLVGVAMGYYLDQWLGSQPWLTILFFFFGSAAGFRMMYRSATETTT